MANARCNFEALDGSYNNARNVGHDVGGIIDLDQSSIIHFDHSAGAWIEQEEKTAADEALKDAVITCLEAGISYGEARSRRGLGTMTHHEDLVEADRLVADCMDRIARQREVIATRYEQGLPVDVAESMLRALEESLRAVGKHRQYIVERLKDAEPT